MRVSEEQAAAGKTRPAAIAVFLFVALAGASQAQDIGVFVSSERTDGSIDEPGFATGLDSADAICQRLGTGAFPGSGPWVAWLSTDDPRVHARDRVPEPGLQGDYVRASAPATVIAADLLDLIDEQLSMSIRLDETGAVASGTAEPWTGTRGGGVSAGSDDCQAWTERVGAGIAGRPHDTDRGWTFWTVNGCGGSQPVYCFGALPGPDQDGDGVPNDLDVCPDTTIPESVPTRWLGVNRFALVDDDGIFDTTAPPGGGNGPGGGFTVEETAGCSCEQIIVALGLGQGHTKFGCSISAMEAWTELVNP